MRGFLGRHNADKLQTGLHITSYEEALYPPRAYHYHLQQDPGIALSSPAASLDPNAPHSASLPPPLVVLPSIDADSICEPQSQQPQSQQQQQQNRRPTGVTSGASASSGTAVNKRPPPCLSKFFDCYVPSPSVMNERRLFDVLSGPHSGWREPLNIFHYPNLMLEPPYFHNDDAKASLGSLLNNKEKINASDLSVTIERQQVALLRLAEVARIPVELSSFVTAIGTKSVVELHPAAGKRNSKQEGINALRIRAYRRPQPPRPIRRGAKVILDTENAPISTGSRVDGVRVGTVDKFGKPTTDAATTGKKRPRSGEGPDAENLADVEHENDSDNAKHSANEEDDDDDDADKLSVGFFEEDDNDYGDDAKNDYNDDNENDFF